MNRDYWHVLQSLQVHPGPDGLAIPDLRVTATLEEIHAAVTALRMARERLELKQNWLEQNTGRLWHSLNGR